MTSLILPGICEAIVKNPNYMFYWEDGPVGEHIVFMLDDITLHGRGHDKAQALEDLDSQFVTYYKMGEKYEECN